MALTLQPSLYCLWALNFWNAIYMRCFHYQNGAKAKHNLEYFWDQMYVCSSEYGNIGPWFPYQSWLKEQQLSKGFSRCLHTNLSKITPLNCVLSAIWSKSTAQTCLFHSHRFMHCVLIHVWWYSILNCIVYSMLQKGQFRWGIYIFEFDTTWFWCLM